MAHTSIAQNCRALRGPGRAGASQDLGVRFSVPWRRCEGAYESELFAMNWLRLDPMSDDDEIHEDLWNAPRASDRLYAQVGTRTKIRSIYLHHRVEHRQAVSGRWCLPSPLIIYLCLEEHAFCVITAAMNLNLLTYKRHVEGHGIVWTSTGSISAETYHVYG